MLHTGRTRKNPEDYVWSPEEQGKCHKWRKHFAHYHDYDASYAWRPTAWLPSGWVWHLAHDGRFRRMQVDKVSAFNKTLTSVSIGPVILQVADNRHRHDSHKVVGRDDGDDEDDGGSASGGEEKSSDSKSGDTSGSESSEEEVEAPKKPAAVKEDVKRDALGLPISQQDAEEEAAMLRQIGAQLRLKSSDNSNSSNALLSGSLFGDSNDNPMQLVGCDWCDANKAAAREKGSKLYTIPEVLVQKSDVFGELVDAVTRTGLLATLSARPKGNPSHGRCWTLFAPRNTGFLPTVADVPGLKSVLLNHVAIGCFNYTALTKRKGLGFGTQNIKMFGGAIRTLKVKGGVLFIDGTPIIGKGEGAEIKASNGVIYQLASPIGANVVAPMHSYEKWQEQQQLAGMRFICGNATIGASESATATTAAAAPSAAATAAPALRLSAEEATNVANEYAEKPLVNEAALKESIKNAVESGAPVELEFEHKYVANMAGLQIKGAIEPALVQHVHVTLSGKTHTLPSGNKAYYFDLGIAPSSVEHGPNAEKRAVASKALKIEFNKQEMQYAPKLISKQLDLLVEGKVHAESIAATQKQLDKLICEALTPGGAGAAAAAGKK